MNPEFQPQITQMNTDDPAAEKHLRSSVPSAAKKEPAPKISVIVPVYKVEKYLPECIESVLAQTFTDFELILVDDGSPDNSGAICDAYAARDPRIRVFHKKNGGVVSARMHGLANSSGAYVIFLDGDDTWTKTALTGLFSIASESGADFVRGGFFYEAENKEIRRVVSPNFQGAFDVDNLLKRQFKTLFDYTAMCVGGNLYRKEIAHGAMNDVGNVRINHSEDGLFAAAAFLRSRKIAFVRDPFYYYLQREGSAVHRFNPHVVEAQDGFCRAMEKILRASSRLSEDRIREIMREHAFNSCAYVFGMLRKAPCLKDMRRMLERLHASEFFISSRSTASSQRMKRRVMILLMSDGVLMECARIFLSIIRTPSINEKNTNTGGIGGSTLCAKCLQKGQTDA